MNLEGMTSAERASAFRAATQIVQSPGASVAALEQASGVLALSTIAKHRRLASEVREALQAPIGFEPTSEAGKIAQAAKRREEWRKRLTA